MFGRKGAISVQVVCVTALVTLGTSRVTHILSLSVCPFSLLLSNTPSPERCPISSKSSNPCLLSAHPSMPYHSARSCFSSPSAGRLIPPMRLSYSLSLKAILYSALCASSARDGSSIGRVYENRSRVASASGWARTLSWACRAQKAGRYSFRTQTSVLGKGK